VGLAVCCVLIWPLRYIKLSDFFFEMKPEGMFGSNNCIGDDDHG
jgi:hypothetical protein